MKYPVSIADLPLGHSYLIKCLAITFGFISLLIYSCSPLQSLHDQHAYQEEIALKVEAQSVMDKALQGETYHENQEAIDQLLLNLETLYEYEKRRENNVESVKIIEIIKNPEKNNLAGFIKFWKEKGEAGETISPAFVQEAKGQVTEGFELLIDLEDKKTRPGGSTIQNFINKNQ